MSHFGFFRLLKITSVVLGLVAAAFTIVGTWISWQGHRASLSISNIEFEPVIPVADKRVRVAIILKNSGGNAATIDGMATDRREILSAKPKYGLAHIASVQIPAGGELRVISDLGVRPLIFTAPEIKSIKNGNLPFKIAGFVQYSDEFSWFLGGTVLGFCYVWDPQDTSAGNFSACSEKNYTYSYHYWFRGGIPYEDVPMVTIGPQTVSPTTPGITFVDPRYPIKTLETRSK